MLFNERLITGDNVKDNLLRLKVPDPDEEQDELWAASTDLKDSTEQVIDDEELVYLFRNQSNIKTGFYILIKWI